MKIILKHLTNKQIEVVESTLNKIQIIEIKELFSQSKGYRIDTINLYKHNSELYNDKDYIIQEEEFDEKILMYTVVKGLSVKVIIEYFLNNIEKIFIDISLYASIYMLKFIIMKRIKIPIKEQSIINSKDQKALKDDHTIQTAMAITSGVETIDYTVLFTNNKVLNLQLIRVSQKGPSLGLDFSFALMKNVKKVEFSEEAPSYREITDGLCLFFICKNSKCRIYNQIFIKNYGFGKFDILREISVITCFKCSYGIKNLEARNIGFVNCEWCYKGILVSNNKSSIISGDGITTDDKLHVLNETNLKNTFEKLEIQTKETTFKYIPDSSDKAENEEDDIFDDIQLNDEQMKKIYELEKNQNNITNKSFKPESKKNLFSKNIDPVILPNRLNSANTGSVKSFVNKIQEEEKSCLIF